MRSEITLPPSKKRVGCPSKHPKDEARSPPRAAQVEARIRYLSGIGNELSQCAGETQQCEHAAGAPVDDACEDADWSGSFREPSCSECRVRWNNVATGAFNCSSEEQYQVRARGGGCGGRGSRRRRSDRPANRQAG